MLNEATNIKDILLNSYRYGDVWGHWWHVSTAFSLPTGWEEKKDLRDNTFYSNQNTAYWATFFNVEDVEFPLKKDEEICGISGLSNDSNGDIHSLKITTTFSRIWETTKPKHTEENESDVSRYINYKTCRHVFS